MKIVAAQWNIQAAKVLKEGADPKESSSYTGDNPEYFAEILSQYSPDIITLQEVHANQDRNQATEIASFLGLEHIVTDSYESESFIDKSYGLSQSIISKYPLLKVSYTEIEYERFEFESPIDPDELWFTREQGVTVAESEINGTVVHLMTTHLIPFRFFGLDAWAAKGPANVIRNNFQKIIAQTQTPWLLQGDMNVNTDKFSKYLGSAADAANFNEVEQRTGTNPHGQILDHVATKGIKIISNIVDTNVRADHYLLITELEI